MLIFKNVDYTKLLIDNWNIKISIEDAEKLLRWFSKTLHLEDFEESLELIGFDNETNNEIGITIKDNLLTIENDTYVIVNNEEEIEKYIQSLEDIVDEDDTIF
jgi:molybdate-binding protein